MALHLTFDDGPDPVWTPAVLDTLAAHEARATFFVLAPAAERAPDLIGRIRAEGHEVALHADRHRRHTGLSQDEIAADCHSALERLDRLGVSPRRWRTPWGVVTPGTESVASQLCLELCDWTLDSHDWRGDDACAMAESIGPRVDDGEVVLMHDGLGPGARRLGCAATVALTRRLLTLAGGRGLAAEPLAHGRVELAA